VLLKSYSGLVIEISYPCKKLQQMEGLQMRKITKNGVALLAGTVALVAFAGLAQAETRFAVQDATGTVDKMVVTDTGSIGINISNPVYKLQIVGSGDPSTAAVLISNPGRATGFLPADSGGFSFMRNNDISVNNGLPRAYDRLGYFGFGSNIAGANRWLGMVQVFAEANATPTTAPTYLTIATSAATGLGAVERVRINSAGNFGIGTSNPTQKLEVNGGLRLNTTTVKPTTCSAAVRGLIWVTQGASSVADTLHICLKDANNLYAWVQIH
jgi:hypothetical protein